MAQIHYTAPSQINYRNLRKDCGRRGFFNFLLENQVRHHAQCFLKLFINLSVTTLKDPEGCMEPLKIHVHTKLPVITNPDKILSKK